MTWSIETTGTQTATINTDHTLAAPTTQGTRLLKVDVSAMVAGDTLQLWVAEKATSGGTVRIVDGPYSYVGQQAEPIVELIHAGSFGCEFHLKQTVGTGRAFGWSVSAQS